jgi:integrase
VQRFIRFHGKRHPKDTGGPEIEAFHAHLAVEGHVAASTQNQALSVLLFLHCTVLHQELDYAIDAARAKPLKHLPEVLTKDEFRQVVAQMSGIYHLQAKLLCVSGQRRLECLHLRVKGLDFERRVIIVRDTKGGEVRVTMLPDSVIKPLKEHLVRAKWLHQEDLTRGCGAVYLPDALERKLPSASRKWIRQYAFLSEQLSVDPRSGETRRHHLEPIRKLIGVEKGGAFRYKWVVKRLTKTEMRLEQTYYHKTGSGELPPGAAQSVAPGEAPTAAGTAASPTGPAAHCQSARVEWDLVHLVDRLPMEGRAS